MPTNVISGFDAAGLYPFQPDKWNDGDFYLAQVTDRPNPVLPNHDIINPDETSQQIADTTLLTTPQQVAHNSTTIIPSDQQPNGSSVMPETIRPLLIAAARKQAMGGKKKLSSTILIDIPIKEQLRKEQTERKLKEINKKTRVGLPVAASKVEAAVAAPKVPIKRRICYDFNNDNSSSSSSNSNVKASTQTMIMIVLFSILIK